MVVAAYVKDPNDVLDYTIDWATWLATGDTITVSTFTVPTGLTKQSESNTTTFATVWLTGGTAGVEYVVTNHVTSAAGRQEDQTIIVLVLEK